MLKRRERREKRRRRSEGRKRERRRRGIKRLRKIFCPETKQQKLSLEPESVPSHDREGRMSAPNTRKNRTVAPRSGSFHFSRSKSDPFQNH